MRAQPERRIAIIAAMDGELKPLVRDWQRITLEDTVAYRTIFENAEVLALSCGIGRVPAARACTLAMEGGPLSALVSIGWSGALSCGMKPGHAFTVNEVIDAATGERYQTASSHEGPSPVRLVTGKSIAGKTEKRKLAENYSAVLVDMEAATVARLARVHTIPFYCVKAVSDEANESLPDMNPFLTSAGHIDMGRFVASILVKPKYWPALVRMGKNSSSGAIAMAAAVQQMLSEFTHAHDRQGT